MSATEKLRRVERFEELREGVMVVVKPCGWCSGEHRSMIIATGIHAPCGASVEFAPKAKCGPNCICECAVYKGHVYRVIDEEPTQETRTRELELVDR